MAPAQAAFARKLIFNTNADFVGVNGSPDPCCRCFIPHDTWPLQDSSPVAELPRTQAVRGSHLDTSSGFSSITGLQREITKVGPNREQGYPSTHKVEV